MIFFSCVKRRLPSFGSIDFFRNEQYISADSFSSWSTRNRPVTSFPIIADQIMTTEPLYWCRIPIAQLLPLKTHPSGSFGDVLDSPVKRTVFMFVNMNLHDRSTHKSLFQGVRYGILIVHLIEAAIIPMVWLRVVYLQPSFVENYSAFCSRNYAYLFWSNRNLFKCKWIFLG